MTLHPVDTRVVDPTDLRLQQTMLFCILDSNTSYASVCKGYDGVNKCYENSETSNHILLSTWLDIQGVVFIRRVLRKSGYPWYNQKARYLLGWARSRYSDPMFLRTADRDSLSKNIPGIGMKLASMFVRNTRKVEVAVLDRHIIRWLKERHSWVRNRIDNMPKNWYEYGMCETYFIQDADEMNVSPYDLDLKIWEERRV